MSPHRVCLIICGLITETSIYALFQAAFIPGFILGGSYIVYIIFRTQLHPEQAPMPTYVANLIAGADRPTMGILAVMMLAFLFLGCIMGWVGIVLLVMPVFLPIVLKLPVEEIGLTDSSSFNCSC